MTQPADLPPLPTDRHTDARAVLIVLCAFAAFVAAVAMFGTTTDRIAVDQNLFHLPVIRQFVAQWPRPDISNYASATAPGYHLLLAGVARYASDDVRVLRCVGGGFGFLLVGLLARAAARRSALLALPAAASVYVLTSTVWLLPENAAWALIALAMILALRGEGGRWFLACAVVLALLVFVRQSAAWLLGVFVVAAACVALIRPAATRYDANRPDHPAVTPRPNGRRIGLIVVFTIFALLPAVVVLAALVALWHGLTPPAFQPGSGIDLPLATKAGGVAPAAPAMVLALLGLFGTPLLAWLWPTREPKRVARVVAIGVVAGFVVGVLPMTNYTPFDRRSGIWNLVRVLPTLADRSPLIVALAALGGGVAALALARLAGRERWVHAAALVGFTVSQTANVLLWQRYYEPFVLIWLTLATAMPGTATPDLMSPSRRRLGYAGIAALTAFQLAAVVYTLRRGA